MPTNILRISPPCSVFSEFGSTPSWVWFLSAATTVLGARLQKRRDFRALSSLTCPNWVQARIRQRKMTNYFPVARVIRKRSLLATWRLKCWRIQGLGSWSERSRLSLFREIVENWYDMRAGWRKWRCEVCWWKGFGRERRIGRRLRRPIRRIRSRCSLTFFYCSQIY